MDRGTTIFFMDKCRCGRKFAIALHHQADLKQAQSILTLDGYHVGVGLGDLHYDEDSQTVQGDAQSSGAFREIQQQLAQKTAQLFDLENQFSNNSKACNSSNNLAATATKCETKAKELQQLDVQIAKLQKYRTGFCAATAATGRSTETTGCAA